MARIEKKLVYKATEHAFSKGAAGALIPHLPFEGGKEYPNTSLKNKVEKPSTGEITATLSDKIAKAVSTSQCIDGETILGWGKRDDKEFIIGQFSGGSKSGTEIFVIIPDDKKIICSAPHSHLFYKVVMGYDLLNFVKKAVKATAEDKEIFERLLKLKNLKTSVSLEDFFIVDIEDTDDFIVLCDSIYFTAKQFDGFEIENIEDIEDARYINYLCDIQYNILPLFAMHNHVTDLTLEIEDEIIKEIHSPKIKKASKTKKGKLEDTSIPLKDRNWGLMSDEEAEKLPDDLKRTRALAIDLFERNKEFLTDELWEAIASFYNGRIWKMGFYGPSASGKTTFVKMMAGALKLPFAIVTGNGDTETSHLFGTMQVTKGSTFFCEGPLTKIMKHGGIFFFDERNMVNAGVVAATNNILDDTKMYQIPQTGELVVAGDLFRYVEAFNVGYEGTKDDNLSHISRIDEWHKLSGYDEEKESDILVKETGIDKETAKKIIQTKNKISTQIINEGDETVQRVDLRSALSWAKKTMDLEGNVVRAALTTILTPLSKEVDMVLNSENEDKFQGTGDPVVDYAMQIIKDTFNKKAKKASIVEYVFETLELK